MFYIINFGANFGFKGIISNPCLVLNLGIGLQNIYMFAFTKFYLVYSIAEQPQDG
jgi:hypothetical protein